MTTLKVQSMTINGAPYGCPECAISRFDLDTAGPFDAWPSLGNCANSCHWEDEVITNQVLKAILAVRTGRKRATDDDTFRLVVHSAVLEGVLVPEVTIDDVRHIGKIYWRRLVKPAVRRQKNRAKRAVRKGVRSAVTAPLGKAAGEVTAAALTAAWEGQAGGWEEVPLENPCGACDGEGSFDLESRIHKQSRVVCSVCKGTGETP